MKLRSLRLRLLFMALVANALALAISGVGLVYLFERHVEQRIDSELETYLNQLAGLVTFAPDGTATISTPLSDPRFDQPLSGLYWQVGDDARGTLLRSRSLWDTTLALPRDTLGNGAVHRHELAGPGKAQLIVRERSITYRTGGDNRTLRIAVGIDASEARTAARAFAGDLIPSLILLGAVLLGAAWAQVQLGLRPLEEIRRGVGAIRSGIRRRLPHDFPEEVMPLAEEVNNLLDAQEKAIEQARASAGDLAHGLKTPLTALAADARALRERGDAETARNIEDIAEAMHRHIERALTKARLRGSQRTATPVAPLAERLIQTIRKTPLGSALQWENEIAPHVSAAIDPDDLAELLGNIIENAAKWARTRVCLSSIARDGIVTVVIDDDGPGIPEASRHAVLERGVRLDQTKSGSGLGLAIVGDIVEAYGGELTLEESPLGGLRVGVKLPSARRAPHTQPH
ncbi:sensor histidine kinase [Parvibaculum sedimenti]|uniref:histidine kinase n=1 Tax=Parvibaculum sedimenti TaxID=2608632 RepID=A0A6N6VPS6_9HYPH|nr:sensor histidine kinase [Parvibaculum sedimenti]KAB7741524.1 sensor histidine kinase [Parvibaculum sedimenti]